MARVALISMYDRMTIGLGCLVSFLKANGHEPYVVYFMRYEAIKPRKLPDSLRELSGLAVVCPRSSDANVP